MVLCIPSPACKERVGEKIGSGRVDLWGDSVKCQPLPGGSWTIRHDRTKAELMRMLGWSGIVATCEVGGPFQHLIPPAARDRVEIKNQSHVMFQTLGSSFHQVLEHLTWRPARLRLDLQN